ncbi:MAG: RNA polymerase sigma factor [Spirochaetes bacterium]|nr:RNA polymerase sigma factor [Spirochaetota bacterium]
MDIDVEMLYNKYGPMVLRRCRSILNNEEKALDAMQDVFVQVLKKKNKLKATYPSSLLYTIATNICLNKIRHEKRHSTVNSEDLIDNLMFIDDFQLKMEAREFLEMIFSSEKESTRDIAFLHFVDGLTLQETADRIGLSISGVRKRLRLLMARAGSMKEKYHE